MAVHSSELRNCPTVTFVRAVYGIKGLMIAHNALLGRKEGWAMTHTQDIRYQAYLTITRQRLLETAGGFIGFLDDRNVTSMSMCGLARGEECDGDAGRETRSVNLHEIVQEPGPAEMGEGGVDKVVRYARNSQAQDSGHVSYFSTEPPSEDKYGSELDAFQMPELAGFPFLAGEDFGFSDFLFQQDSLDRSMALPGRPT